MSVITDRDPEEMDHDELRNEWNDVVEELRRPADDPGDHDDLWDRRKALWNEMASRVDAEPPECPECGAQSWAQSMGDPKYCTQCSMELGMAHEELIQEIDEYWERVQSGPQEAEA